MAWKGIEKRKQPVFESVECSACKGTGRAAHDSSLFCVPCLGKGTRTKEVKYPKKVKAREPEKKAQKDCPDCGGTGVLSVSGHEIDCNGCLGTGSVDAEKYGKRKKECPDCDGIGHVQSAKTYTEECSTCGGLGWWYVEECEYCQGFGRVVEKRGAVTGVCPSCQGEGTVFSPFAAKEEPEITKRETEWCVRCKGTGETSYAGSPYKCPDCDGMGWHYVEEEPEEGLTKECPICAGNGETTEVGVHITCSRCRGYGVIPTKPNVVLCSWCDGVGTDDMGIDCNSCDGEGWKEREPVKEEPLVPCHDCQGRGYSLFGEEQCKTCGGVGKIPFEASPVVEEPKPFSVSFPTEDGYVEMTPDETEIFRVLFSNVPKDAKTLEAFKRLIRDRNRAELAKEPLKKEEPKEIPKEVPPIWSEKAVPLDTKKLSKTEARTAKILSGLEQVTAQSVTVKSSGAEHSMEVKLVGAGIISLQRVFIGQAFTGVSQCFRDLLQERVRLRDWIIQLEQDQEEQAWSEPLEDWTKKLRERQETESFVVQDVLKTLENDLWGLKKPYIREEQSVSGLVSDLKAKVITDQLRAQLDPFMMGIHLSNFGKKYRDECNQVMAYACYIEAARMHRLNDTIIQQQECLLNAAQCIQAVSQERTVEICDDIIKDVQACPELENSPRLEACSTNAFLLRESVIKKTGTKEPVPVVVVPAETIEEPDPTTLQVPPTWVHLESQTATMWGYDWSNIVSRVQIRNEQLGNALTYAIVEEVAPQKLRLGFTCANTYSRRSFKIVSHFVVSGELPRMFMSEFGIDCRIQVERTSTSMVKEEVPFSTASQELSAAGGAFVSEGTFPPPTETTKGEGFSEREEPEEEPDIYEQIMTKVRERLPSADLEPTSRLRVFLDGILSPLRGKTTWTGDIEGFLSGLSAILSGTGIGIPASVSTGITLKSLSDITQKEVEEYQAKRREQIAAEESMSPVERSKASHKAAIESAKRQEIEEQVGSVPYEEYMKGRFGSKKG